MSKIIRGEIVRSKDPMQPDTITANVKCEVIRLRGKTYKPKLTDSRVEISWSEGLVKILVEKQFISYRLDEWMAMFHAAADANKAMMDSIPQAHRQENR